MTPLANEQEPITTVGGFCHDFDECNDPAFVMSLRERFSQNLINLLTEIFKLF